MALSSSCDSSREVRLFYLLFAASQFLTDSSIWSFFLTRYHHFSLTEAFAFHAGLTALSGLFDIPTGSWADRFGRRRVVILGFLSRALGAFLMIFASSGPVLILAAVSSGFGCAQLSGAAEALFYDNLKARGQESEFRRYMSNSVMMNYCSRTVAFVASGALFGVHPTLPYIALIVALLVGVCCAFWIQELPFARTTALTNPAHIRQGVLIFSTTPHLLRMSIFMLVAIVLTEQLWFSLQPLLSAAGLQPFQVGVSYALGAFASLIGARLAKWFLVRHHDEIAFSIGVVTCGCGGLLFALLDGPALVMVAQMVTCVGFGLLASSRGSILNSSLPSAHRAVCVSIFSSSEGVLMGLIGASLGYLYENYGRSYPPLVVACACFVLVPFLYRSIPRASAAAGTLS